MYGSFQPAILMPPNHNGQGLHDGHVSLAALARDECELVIASVFVNPKQFSVNDTDGGVDKYPRTLEADLALLEAQGVDYVFAPDTAEMYPERQGKRVQIHAVGYDKTPEGLCRPEFFDGVGTIVAKLFNIVNPSHAYFGQKDAMQCVLIQQLVEDLNYNIEIRIGETKREANGLARSTRNQYLTPEEKESAAVIHRALSQAQTHLAQSSGAVPATKIQAIVRAILLSEPRITEIQYISVASKPEMDELDTISADRGGIISVAVMFGDKRSIDNIVI